MEYENNAYTQKNSKSVYRNYMEGTLNAIAEVLRLRKFDYKELYLSILEATAKLFKIQKYNIYTIEELIASIREKEVKKDLPPFVYIILNRVPEDLETEE